MHVGASLSVSWTISCMRVFVHDCDYVRVYFTYRPRVDSCTCACVCTIVIMCVYILLIVHVLVVMYAYALCARMSASMFRSILMQC